ncbi:MAG: ABC transporter ATP-binding protein [Gaiellales bacterium]
MRLELTGLEVAFGDRVVANVPQLAIGEGEIVGLVGESGSGKSMTALAVIGLARGMGATVSGSVKLDGQELLTLPEGRLREVRGRRIAMIFQAPISSLNPVFRVGDVFVRALRLHGASSAEARARAQAAMREVLLPAELLRRYPNQLSGGQAQRVAIAMAVALRAEVLLADEPTPALDVTVQAEVLDVLRRLRAEEGMAILFVSHDLAVVSSLCSRVTVMRRGEVVEAGPVSAVLETPAHTYTRELISAVPRLGGAQADARG